MKSKHTPGPWEVFEARDCYHIHDGDGQHIANSWNGEKVAQLIAAAPDLLEACIGLLEVFAYDAEPMECITRAKEAILKAKGENV